MSDGPALLLPSRRDILSAGLSIAFVVTVAVRAASAQRHLTVHVDPGGDDHNDGMSPATAWRTLARANAAILLPGDRIVLRRGGVWRETLRPSGDGVTIGGYGEGPRPIVTASDMVAIHRFIGKTAALGLWAGDVRAEPTQVFVEGERIERVAHVADLRHPAQWCFDSDEGLVLAVHASQPPPEWVEASVRESALDLQDRSGVVVEGLAVMHGARDCILARTLDRSAIVDCRIEGGFVAGLQLGGEHLRRGLIVRGNHVLRCGGVGIGFGGRIEHWIIEENLVEQCATLTEHAIGDGREASFAWTAGIKNWGWGAPGWQVSYFVRRNVVRDCGPAGPVPAQIHGRAYGHGIWCDEVLKPTTRPQIYDNVVERCWSRGIYLEKTDEHDVRDNLIVDCAAVNGAGSIEVQSNRYGYDVVRDQPDDNVPRRVSGNNITHNTVVGGSWTLTVYCEDLGCSLSNNEVARNILVEAPGRGGSIYAGGGGANNGRNGSGNVYRDNCVGRRPSALRWHRRTYRDARAFENASQGAVSGTLAIDPVFVAPEAGDHRFLQPSAEALRRQRVGKRW